MFSPSNLASSHFKKPGQQIAKKEAMIPVVPGERCSESLLSAERRKKQNKRKRGGARPPGGAAGAGGSGDRPPSLLPPPAPTVSGSPASTEAALAHPAVPWVGSSCRSDLSIKNKNKEKRARSRSVISGRSCLRAHSQAARCLCFLALCR